MREKFIGWRITPKMGQGSAAPHSPTAQFLGAHSECSSSPLKLSLGLVTLPSLVLPTAGPLGSAICPPHPSRDQAMGS